MKEPKKDYAFLYSYTCPEDLDETYDVSIKAALSFAHIVVKMVEDTGEVDMDKMFDIYYNWTLEEILKHSTLYSEYSDEQNNAKEDG